MTEVTTNNWRRRWGLPFAFFAGPVLWMAQIVLGYGVVPYVCAHDLPALYGVFVGAIALVILLSGYLAYWNWKQIDPHPDLADTTTMRGTREFLSVCGAYLSSLFLVMVVVTGVSGLFLSPCPIITLTVP